MMGIGIPCLWLLWFSLHPSLVSKDFEPAPPEDGCAGGGGNDIHDRLTTVLNNLKPAVKTRLLEENLRTMECPVCLDM